MSENIKQLLNCFTWCSIIFAIACVHWLPDGCTADCDDLCVSWLVCFPLLCFSTCTPSLILFFSWIWPLPATCLLKSYSSSTAQLLPLCTFPQNTRLGTNLFLTQDWKHTILSTPYVALCTFCLGLMIFVSAICFLYNSNILEREN